MPPVPVFPVQVHFTKPSQSPGRMSSGPPYTFCPQVLPDISESTSPAQPPFSHSTELQQGPAKFWVPSWVCSGDGQLIPATGGPEAAG